MPHLVTALAEFAADLRLAGRADGTITHHLFELERLGRWCEAGGLEWAELGRAQLQQYTRGRAHLSASTRANMLCTLRTFYGWAVAQGYVALSPAAGFVGPKKPSPLPRALTLDQVRRLLAYLASCEGRRARRDEALLLTGLYAGLRAAELGALRWPAVDQVAGVINIRLSKMGKGRAVKIHRALAPVLASWRQVQGLGPDVALFGLEGQPLTSNRVGKIARNVSLALGIKFTPHTLRHTFATWAVRRSGNVYAVSKALGHSQLKQTEIYLSSDPADGAPAIDALPPLDQW